MENKLIPLDAFRRGQIAAVLNDVVYRRIARAQRNDPDLMKLERMERRNVESDNPYHWDELTLKRVGKRKLE